MSNRSVSRRRARRAGLLATLVAALLTPAGTIIAGSATAALALGAIMTGKHHDVPSKTDPREPAPIALHAPASHGGAPGIALEPPGEMLQVSLHDAAPGGLPQGMPLALTAPPQTGSASGGPSGMPRAGKAGPHGPGPDMAGPIIPPGPSIHPTPGPGSPSHPPARIPGETDTPKPSADNGQQLPKNAGHVPSEPDEKADSSPGDEPPVVAGPSRTEKQAQNEEEQDNPDVKNDQNPDRTPPSPGKDPLLPVGTLPDTSGPGDTLPDSALPGDPSAQQTAAVPEPSVIGLLLLGAAALFASRRRRPAGQRA